MADVKEKKNKEEEAMEIPELKNTVTEIENSMDGFYSRLDVGYKNNQ